MKRVCIIGGGIGGLATANLLAELGYQVEVVEKNQQLGGRAGLINKDGFLFDTGPSWYLMPEVFEQYFNLLGEDITKYIRLTRLDPAYQVFFESSTEPVVIHADIETDAATFEKIEPGAGQALRRYLKASEQMYHAAVDNFLYTNFSSLHTMAGPSTLRMLPKIAAAALKPIDSYVRSYFSNEKLIKIMEYPMVFLGTSPYEAPAMYSLMSHMDFNQGVFYPMGGMYTIIEAMAEMGTKRGVVYRCGETVQKIEAPNNKTKAVILESGERLEADIIISNADLHHTETKLLEPSQRTYPSTYWQKRQAGPSALLMYLGTKGNLTSLKHHNLIFTDDWQRNFDDIFYKKKWPKPASIYISKPSYTDPAVAPKQHENVFVLVPGPARLDPQDENLAPLADEYLRQIATAIGAPDLKDRIVYKQMVGPHDFVANYNSWLGTALGMSHKLRQSAMFRPANKSRRVEGLYYVGGNTVPGIGLPMCLIGAELVVKRIIGNKSHRPLRELNRL